MSIGASAQAGSQPLPDMLRLVASRVLRTPRSRRQALVSEVLAQRGPCVGTMAVKPCEVQGRRKTVLTLVSSWH